MSHSLCSSSALLLITVVVACCLTPSHGFSTMPSHMARYSSRVVGDRQVPTIAHQTGITTTTLHMGGIFDSLRELLKGPGQTFPAPCVMGDESIMSQKSHGTSQTPVQSNLRWGCDYKTADRICNFNRHYAEFRGYFQSTAFLAEAQDEYLANGQITFYDSNSGKPLFVAPKNRSLEDFIRESRSHGWPSFRDEEVVWENVRCLPNGEAVSVDGTHLGHNLPDFGGSRYCINLVSVAGRSVEGEGGGVEN